MARRLDIQEWLPELRGERPRAIAAATTLFAAMASHALRETARDALFLSGLPAARLPWAYLAIAVLALAAGLAGRSLLGARSHRVALVATLLCGAAVDVGFWWLAPASGSGTLFALYVWTGLLATAVTVQVWLHLADVFDVDEAKRAFPVIAAGGLGGAVAGSALASALVSFQPVRSLLLGASLLFVAAAWLAWRVHPRGGEESADAAAAGEAATALPEAVRALAASPYLRRVLALAALTALLGTGVDFVFKTTVAAEIPRARLGEFFARFSALVNTGALVFQLFAAPVLLQSIGVVRSVAVLPELLLLGSGALAAFGGLVPVLALRGSDAVVRHSLHRSGTEILYLPIEPGLRATFKTLVDSLGQRGGQALASLGILIALAWHVDVQGIALALLVGSGLALLSLLGLRSDYVARFRAQLRALDPELRVAVPSLDLHSLEALVAALSSPHDREVLSALGLLEASGRTQLVPPLILHHPSPAVVLRALALLAGTRHPHVDAAIERLLAHRDPEVRAAALRAYAARAPGSGEVLRLLREDPSQAVRVAALVAWTGWQRDARELETQAAEILEHGGREARVALARSLPSLPYPLVAGPVRAVLASRDPVLHAELANAAAGDARPERLPLLIALLARRASRRAARPILLSLGDTALIALTRAHRSAETPEAVRRQLARTLARLPSAAAVPPLVEALAGGDARLRHRALRALARLRAHDPTLPVPDPPLLDAAHAALERAVTLLYYRAVQALWDELHPPAPGPAADLLPALLDEKIERALERAFLALHVREPAHGYGLLFRALRHGGARRAGSREVLEHVVEGALREGLLAMVDGEDPLERLRGAARYFAPEGAEALLELFARGERAKDLSEAGRARLAALARAAFDAAQEDADAILASVARRRYGRAPGAPAGGAGADDGA